MSVSSLGSDLMNISFSSPPSPLLNPLAPVFHPSSSNGRFDSVPEAGTSYELRNTLGKGMGVFATKFIPRGSLILHEQPFLKIEHNVYPSEAWGAYTRLSESDKAEFDTMYSRHIPKRVDLEWEARVFLANTTKGITTKDDKDKLISEQIRVMGIYGNHCYGLPDGGGAIYSIASRLNHSCVPNVHLCCIKHVVEVYANRDIYPSEELEITYLSSSDTCYLVRNQRIERLNVEWGFVCKCWACLTLTGISDHRRSILALIVLGLQRYLAGERSMHTFIPNSHYLAVKQADDAIKLMLSDNVITQELKKAYHTAGMLANELGDFKLVVEYAKSIAEIEYLGPTGDEVRYGLAPLVRNSQSIQQHHRSLRDGDDAADAVPAAAKPVNEKTRAQKMKRNLQNKKLKYRKLASEEELE